MRKKSRITPILEELSIWTAFTDLMSNAFMILSFFLLLSLVKSIIFRSNSEQSQIQLVQAQQKIEQLEKELGKKSSTVIQLTNEIELLKAPPVLIIQDSGEYKFSSGSAELPIALKTYITNELVKTIEEITKEKNIYVVEIIGHTDGQVNSVRASNLDETLESVANGKESISKLQAGSNADLGLMRALEVVKTLQDIQKNGRLQGLQFRAYSAAQLFSTDGNFAPINRESDSQRRRIEIRFSPLGKAETIK